MTAHSRAGHLLEGWQQHLKQPAVSDTRGRAKNDDPSRVLFRASDAYKYQPTRQPEDALLHAAISTVHTFA
jgi:hypothetical protein